MICHFLLLQLLEAVNNSKIPGKCQKQDSVYYTGENELPQSVGAVPSFYCPPTNFPRQVQPGEVASPQYLKSPASVIAENLI